MACCKRQVVVDFSENYLANWHKCLYLTEILHVNYNIAEITWTN